MIVEIICSNHYHSDTTAYAQSLLPALNTTVECSNAEALATATSLLLLIYACYCYKYQQSEVVLLWRLNLVLMLDLYQHLDCIVEVILKSFTIQIQQRLWSPLLLL
jgi:hypothetical protein